jgi:hypothetical protein
MKILTKLVLACAVFALFSLTFQLADGKDKKKGPSAFPNLSEAPTNKTNLAKPAPPGPRISSSLAETNPKSKIKLAEFLDVFKYTLYKLTRGEAEQIFFFADKNKDDQIDHKEWEEFVILYVLPFEACDPESQGVLNEKKFKSCFEADPRTKVVEFRRRYIKAGSGPKHIMDVLQTRGTSLINFSDYLFYRRTLYGWTECHSTAKYLAKQSFKCAVLSTIPQKYNFHLDYEQFYETGLRLSSDRNLIELDFVSYIRVALFMKYFVVFGQPLNLPYLEKAQFIRAVREDRLPTNFEESEINTIYALTNNANSMDFPSFAFFFHLHRLFNKHSIEKPLNLNQAELNNIMNDEDTLKDIVFAIDNSFTNFSEAEYLEASLVLTKKRLNEKSFYSFKQDASVYINATNVNATINANVLDLKANDANRKIFFSIMVGLGKKYWGKTEYYRAFQISNLYVSIRDLPVNHNVGVFIDRLQNLYDQVSPSWNPEQRKNYIFYKALPKDVDIDILTFLSLENFVEKIQVHKFNVETVIEETLLKTILKDNGMENMPDTVIDLAKKGLDSLHRREFIALDVVKYCMIVHSAANELRRTKNTFTTMKLKNNPDNTRIYPQPNRRFLATTNV